MKLPTATVADVLAWNPCSSWKIGSRIADLFHKYGRTSVNALDILNLPEHDIGECDRVWAACHLLPADINLSFEALGCGNPFCCLPGRGTTVWSTICEGLSHNTVAALIDALISDLVTYEATR